MGVLFLRNFFHKKFSVVGSEFDDAGLARLDRVALRLFELGGEHSAALFDEAVSRRRVGHERYRAAWLYRDNLREAREELRDALNYVVFTLDQVERELASGRLSVPQGIVIWGYLADAVDGLGDAAHCMGLARGVLYEGLRGDLMGL